MTAWYVAKDYTYTNRAAHFAAEFFARQRLSKLGFVSNIEDLDSETAEAFLLIDAEVEKIKAQAMKKGK